MASALQLLGNMRTPILLAAAVLSSSLVASADTTVDQLGAGEVRAQVKRVADAQIEECYLGAIGERAGAGRLDVTLTIHRKGIVDRIDVSAPGVPAKVAAKIDTCVRHALDGIEFSARRVGVTVVVPYLWQKTAAVGAGPYESCWNAKGCPTGTDKPAAKQVAQPAKADSAAPVSTGVQARRARASS